MRRDKAALDYGGASQLDRVVELARRHVAEVFVSVRPDQAGDPVRARHPLIVDAFPDGGPVAGIRSAFARAPASAWLVLACDLPFLSDATIAHLIRSRDPAGFATAYRSAYDGLPEPLCAIWEPRSADALALWVAQGRQCPRKFLGAHAAALLDPIDERALDNVNTPEEYARARAAFDTRTPRGTMRIQIRYYALLREQAGRSDETVETSAETPADLYRELGTRHPFTLTPEQLKVAVNGDFSDWTRALRSDDVVVFIPPVAGG
ncbi:MAG: NTP transferase domain-containing protein [Gammaproteobacteria bacterium]|nr:NTP transferase domain-containing protein [Gammaproteobacteria bacterium]